MTQSDQWQNSHILTSLTRNPGLNPEVTTYTTPTTTSLYVDSNKTVLLQTAQVFVYDPNKQQSPLEVRITLNSGSQ